MIHRKALGRKIWWVFMENFSISLILFIYSPFGERNLLVKCSAAKKTRVVILNVLMMRLRPSDFFLLSVGKSTTIWDFLEMFLEIDQMVTWPISPWNDQEFDTETLLVFGLTRLLPVSGWEWSNYCWRLQKHAPPSSSRPPSTWSRRRACWTASRRCSITRMKRYSACWLEWCGDILTCGIDSLVVFLPMKQGDQMRRAITWNVILHVDNFLCTNQCQVQINQYL